MAEELVGCDEFSTLTLHPTLRILSYFSLRILFYLDEYKLRRRLRLRKGLTIFQKILFDYST